MKPQAIERFLAKIAILPNGCWEWVGAHNNTGYGYFVNEASVLVLAHRWAYEYWNGPILNDLTVDHLCRDRDCMNPDHMEIVTRGENALRGFGPMAMNARKTHCKHGHELIGYNLTIFKLPSGNPRRQCRTCMNEGNRRFRKRQKEKL